jgi:hypothetical protein
VRRRVQQDKTGHRGRTQDLLYGIRRVLHRRRDQLSDRARSRLETDLIADDPDSEVTAAWTVAQDLKGLYELDDPVNARRRAEQLVAALRGCPIPGVGPARPDPPHTWRAGLCAHFDHPQVSNVPTENLREPPGPPRGRPPGPYTSFGGLAIRRSSGPTRPCHQPPRGTQHHDHLEPTRVGLYDINNAERPIILRAEIRIVFLPKGRSKLCIAPAHAPTRILDAKGINHSAPRKTDASANAITNLTTRPMSQSHDDPPTFPQAS